MSSQAEESSREIASDLQFLRRVNAIVLDREDSDFRQKKVYCLADSGEEITFCAVDKIGSRLTSLLQQCAGSFSEIVSPDRMARTLAYLWMGLISIHPFEDGNARTAVCFIDAKLRDTTFVINDFHRLKSYLIRGEVAHDLARLTRLFETMLERREPLASEMTG